MSMSIKSGAVSFRAEITSDKENPDFDDDAAVRIKNYARQSSKKN